MGGGGSQGPYLYCNWKLEHLQSMYDVRYEISWSGTTLCVFIHLISKHITTLCNCVVQATRQHRPGIKSTPPLALHSWNCDELNYDEILYIKQILLVWSHIWHSVWDISSVRLFPVPLSPHYIKLLTRVNWPSNHGNQHLEITYQPWNRGYFVLSCLQMHPPPYQSKLTTIR